MSNNNTDSAAGDQPAPSPLNKPTGADEVKHLSLRQRLEQKLPGYDEIGFHQNDRPLVKEGIVRAYDLHKASATLTQLLSEKRVQSNDILTASFQNEHARYQEEIESILSIPTNLLHVSENNLLQFVAYQIEHNQKDITSVKGQPFSRWLENKRLRFSALLDGNRNKLKENIVKKYRFDMELLTKLSVNFTPLCSRPTSFDDRMEQLREFKAKNGHLKVRRLQPDGSSLGEWVHKIRREYDLLKEGKKVHNLNPARIKEMNDMGFIWRVRSQRPKKGDPNYRLRRKSKEGVASQDNKDEENSESNVAKKTNQVDTSAEVEFMVV